MKIITILPISRPQYLDRVIDSLLAQTQKVQGLIVVLDLADHEYLETRNRIVGLNFDQVLCIRSNNLAPARSVPERRKHITNIHNQFRGLIGEADWVFSMEDDSIIPPDALERLIKVIKTKEKVGMATGVELGRWGVPYVGAWTVDDIRNTQVITSVENRVLETSLVQEIDACGLYCALIRADLYKEHEFFTHNGLGPDVNLGLFLRTQGLNNYIAWGVPVTHLTTSLLEEVEITPFGQSRIVTLRLLSEGTWQASSN